MVADTKVVKSAVQDKNNISVTAYGHVLGHTHIILTL